MKTNCELNKRAASAGLLTAVVALASVLSARGGDPGSCSAAKPYPMTTCVVDGKKLSKGESAYVTSSQGQEVKLCGEKCLPKFEKRSAKYLKKLDRAAARAARMDAKSGVAAASESQPGDLGWPGW
jgi:YHS domain-containing protein